MCAAAAEFGLTPKEKAYELQSWQEFFDWYCEVQKEDYEYKGRKEHPIEGFVIEDSRGYMTKLKLPYYNFWKQMRSAAREVAKKGFISNTASSQHRPPMSFMDGCVQSMIRESLKRCQRTSAV